MNKHTFKGILAGISSVGMLFSSADYPDLKAENRRQNQDLDKLRGDWGKIGDDFYSVIQREKTANKKAGHR